MKTECEIWTCLCNLQREEPPENLCVLQRFKEPAEDISAGLKTFRDSFATNYEHLYWRFDTGAEVRFQMAIQRLSVLPDSDGYNAWAFTSIRDTTILVTAVSPATTGSLFVRVKGSPTCLHPMM